MNKRKQRQKVRALDQREALLKLRVKAPTEAAQAVIDEIYEAFEGVDRINAISWNGADLIDNYGMGPGHFPDSDATWEELVNDPRWYGDWCWIYLNPEGFRYYLPAGMIRNLIGNFNVSLNYALSPRGRMMPDPPNLDRWAVLNEPQVCAIRSYFRYFVKLWSDHYDSDEPNSMKDGLETWARFDAS